MTRYQTFRYIDIIDDVTNAHNYRYHRTIKMRRMKGKSLYTLEDYAGDPVEGRFYEEELQPVTVGADDIYQIEKVISSRKRRGQPMAWVEAKI